MFSFLYYLVLFHTLENSLTKINYACLQLLPIKWFTIIRIHGISYWSQQARSTHPILNISFPSTRHCTQVKHLYVSIIIACTHTSLCVVVRISKCNTPAVPFCFPFCWLHACNSITGFSWIPYLHTPCRGHQIE